MSVSSPLTDFVVGRMIDAQGDRTALTDLIAELTAGIGLAVAIAADGDAAEANDLCEAASHGVFQQACLHTGMARMVRGFA
ncbi:hypothetical protein ACFQE0_13910 [Methylobacterium komagatae]|uniref:Uncharacterized protein n=1 Tax=Methylobacterium komagatae TaxID=374425 RepID=A0ABW2BLX5_9HYPH